MRRIKELIVVEGKHDSANLKRYFDVATVETGGSRISATLLSQLKEEKRGIIIFTDPDSNGQKIREHISREIATCRHAYLAASQCRKKNKVGVEYADKASLERALANLVSYEEVTENLKMADLVDLKLSGHRQATANRQKLSERFNLGDCNAKSLLRRLNALALTYSAIQECLADE